MIEIPELTAKHFEHSIPRPLRQRLIRGEIRGGDDITALRRFVQLSRTHFAEALGIGEDELSDWEAGRSRPTSTAVALLRIAARRPRTLHENLY